MFSVSINGKLSVQIIGKADCLCIVFPVCFIGDRKPGFDAVSKAFDAEYANKGILVWALPVLRKKLAEKHKETFWVSAETRKRGDREEFLFKSVEYTRSPHAYQFPDLLATGLITIDHLIKEKGKSAHERGPLFKINKAGYTMLFPSPIKFELG